MEANSFPSNDIEDIKSICSKPPSRRTPEELLLLSHLFENSSLFIKNSENLTIRSLCKHLHYKYIEKDCYVFQQGETGNEFYVIYEGTVSVIVRNREGMSEEVKKLGKNQWFGELSLDNNTLRTASVLCKTNCHFLYLSKHDYQSILSRDLIQNKNTVANFCKNLPIFKHLTMGTLLKLAYSFQEIALKKNHLLYKEGESSESIYIVKEGEMSLYVNVNGTLRKVLIFGKGEINGSYETLFGIDRKVTCVCSSDTATLLTIKFNDFIRKLSRQDLELIKTQSAEKYKDLCTRANFWKNIQKHQPGVSSSRVKICGYAREMSSRANLLKERYRHQHSNSDQAYIKADLLQKSMSKQLVRSYSRSHERSRRKYFKSLLVRSVFKSKHSYRNSKLIKPNL